MACSSMNRREADKYLRSIRDAMGVDRPSDQQDYNQQNLTNALNIIADQLYSKPTHFLLELIQNADDNKFASSTPTLSFHVKNSGRSRYLLVDCNEVGFTKENVKAICNIGQSTKKVAHRRKGFIGEKGIGFKSVFKVADVVRISSGPFQFKFNRTKTLGMIAPIPEPFPAKHTRSGLTQILLYFKHRSDLYDFIDDLEILQPELLIFLQKLFTINISTPKRKLTFQKLFEPNEDFLEGETICLKESDWTDDYVRTTKYIIVRHTVDRLPKDERRAKVATSEVVLAFPIAENTNPIIGHQDVYAFLPIYDFGFSYLIQADFILTANRESLEDEADWNKCLRKGLTEAFLKAALRFTKVDSRRGEPGLRYKWPAFLEEKGSCSSKFWWKLRTEIISTLKDTAILESRDEDYGLRKPSRLWYLPLRFRVNGKPLIEEPEDKKYHLSFLYDLGPSRLQPGLKLLGVKEMNSGDFVRQLRDSIDKHGPRFMRYRSTLWHLNVIKILREHLGTPESLTEFPLVPLRDGRWVAHNERHLYLGTDVRSLVVPNGIHICLVDPEACVNQDREDFFHWLGIRRCTQAEVCRLISEMHRRREHRTIDDFVSDARYFFFSRAFYKPPEDGFYLMDNLSRPALGKFLYVDHPARSFAISKYADESRKNFRMVHADYLASFDDDDTELDFVDWLVRQLGVSTLPKLVRDGRVTREFKFLAASKSRDLLLLLRDNWSYYQKQLHKFVGGPSLSQRTMAEELAELRVECSDGSYHPLGRTVLPLAELREEACHLPFLEIPQPYDSGWLQFEAIGVLTGLNSELYLRQLKAMTELDTSEVKKSAVRKIYNQLSTRWLFSSYSLSDEFSDNPLVFHAKDKRWIFLRDCVWESPSCLKNLYALSNDYSDCKYLFHTVLGLRNAGIDDVVDEILELPNNVSSRTCKELLMLLNEFLINGSPPGRIKRLGEEDIIPVIKSEGRFKSPLFRNFTTDLWYLADKPTLYESFKGKVYLIDFTVREVRKLSPLVRAMNMDRYLLSKAVHESTEYIGDPIYDEPRTVELRSRVRYLIPLVPEMIQDSADEMESLKTSLLGLEVWGAPLIKIRRTIRRKDIEGRESDGNVIFRDTDTVLKIYMPIKNQMSDLEMTFILSEKFIEHCGITDPNYRMLVAPILSFKLDQLKKLLERYDLDQLYVEGPGNYFPETLFKSSIVAKQDQSKARKLDTGQGPASRTRDVAFSEPVNRPSSPTDETGAVLSAKIPTWDQSLAKVREAGASRASKSRLSLFSSRPLPSEVLGIGSSTTASLGSGRGGNFPSQTSTPLPPDAIRRSQDTHSEETSDTSPLPRDAIRRSQDTHSEDRSDTSSLRLSLRGISGSADQETFRVGERESAAIGVDVRMNRGAEISRTQGLEAETNSLQKIHNEHIGVLGEVYMDKFFSRILSAWSGSNWTSRNRKHAGLSRFNGNEKYYTDFTYVDSQGDMTKLLSNNGLSITREWKNLEQAPTYHLEIKATTGPCSEPFVMSNNQLEMAREYTIPCQGLPHDIYVVFRVFNLQHVRLKPDFVIYVDPWAMYMDGSLTFKAWDKYMVTPGTLRQRNTS